MARTRYVTRTLTSTKVTCLCLNTVTCEPSNETVELSGEFKDDEKLLKEASKLINTDNLKAVSIVTKELSDHKYRMPETEFIKYADKRD